MANRKGRAKAQDIYEMISDMTETKPCDIGAENSHGDRLRAILDRTLDDVAGMAKGERVSLEDVEAVKEQTLVYLRACKETLTFPTSLGLARSLGYSDRALRHWRNARPDTPTGRWLEMFNDTCSDIIGQVTLKNATFEKFKGFLEGLELGEIKVHTGKAGKNDV